MAFWMFLSFVAGCTFRGSISGALHRSELRRSRAETKLERERVEFLARVIQARIDLERKLASMTSPSGT